MFLVKLQVIYLQGVQKEQAFGCCLTQEIDWLVSVNPTKIRAQFPYHSPQIKVTQETQRFHTCGLLTKAPTEVNTFTTGEHNTCKAS